MNHAFSYTGWQKRSYLNNLLVQSSFQARTISMMKISREKLAETWKVVKNGTPTYELTHEFLELYRPLFKYVNAKEMTRLNLLDTRILHYVGTHPDLNRHQVSSGSSNLQFYTIQVSSIRRLEFNTYHSHSIPP